MSTSADLMGLGMPPALADRMGNNVIAVNAAGTTSGAATLLPGSDNDTYVVTTGASATGVILGSGLSLGDTVVITVPTATSAVVYPPAGATFNTAASTSLTIAQYKTAEITKLTATMFSVLLSA